MSTHPALADDSTNRVDTVSPMAPELAAFGEFAVGVRTLQVTDAGRIDILNTKEGGPLLRADRTLTLEVWYPAELAKGQAKGGEYRDVMTRDGVTRVTLKGQAVRDAAPLKAAAGYPLVVISHGYPGNRFLLAHLAESLASKGYVCVSIDHKDSTYDDQKAFASTLYNRPLDQLFVVREVARLSEAQSPVFLAGLVDVSRTALVGYSMGGYGLVNAIGGSFTEAVVSRPGAPPNGVLRERTRSDPGYAKSLDPRIKAAIAIAPWGMQEGAWDAEGLAGIETPTLFVAGSADDVSGYAKGTRAVFEGAVHAERSLLTFLNAGHNAGAPIKAPAEVWTSREGRPAGFAHYADPVWDTVRMNNILDHFATAFLDVHLKGRADRRAYLDLIPDGAQGVWAVERDGRPLPGHTYWKGFPNKTAVGLRFEHRPATRD